MPLYTHLVCAILLAVSGLAQEATPAWQYFPFNSNVAGSGLQFVFEHPPANTATVTVLAKVDGKSVESTKTLWVDPVHHKDAGVFPLKFDSLDRLEVQRAIIVVGEWSDDRPHPSAGVRYGLAYSTKLVSEGITKR